MTLKVLRFYNGGEVDDAEVMDAEADDDPSATPPAVTASGGLSALDMPGAAEAMVALLKSSNEARAALQQARQQISARKYNRAIPLLAASAALGAPTRAGSTAESFAAMSGALISPLREKEQFEQQQQKDLLGIGTQLSGLDQNSAMAQLQLAQLRAKLNADMAKTGNDRIVRADGTLGYASHAQARQPGVVAWAPPGSQTNVVMKEEGEEAKTVGKGFGDQYLKLQQAGIDAPSQISKYERLANLMEGMSTGKLTPTFAQLAAIGESFGLKFDPKLGAKQAAEALSNEVALTLRNPAGGAGMPGALSDADREFLRSMTPGLSKTPEGNRLIIETARKLARRDQEVARMARAYRRKNKHFDEGFLDELEDYSNAHPLFAKEGEQSSPAAAVAPPGVAAPADDEGNLEDFLPAQQPGAPPVLKYDSQGRRIK